MRTRIETGGAPKPIGAYSQAIKAGDLIFVSGQIPLDPNSGELVSPGARAQTARVLENIKAIALAAGADFSSIVKTTVYLVDLGWFDEVNEVFSEYFSADPPAREVVQVARLPKGAGIEVSAIAMVRGE